MNSLGPRANARDTLLLFLIPLILLTLNLAGAPLFDVDEGAFSEATREMFVRHDFISTWLNGEPRFDKPILIYWLQAIPVTLAGVGEWSFRLPSALAAALWATALGLFAWRRSGREAGWLATVVAASSLGVFVIGRAATADALLNLWLTLTMLDGWRHLESRDKAPLRRMYLWIGLGVLTKGPIALAIPAVVTLLYCLSRRDLGAWLRASFDPLGWLILIAVAAPWYAAIYAVHGQAFIDGFIMKHNVGRFTGPMEGHGGSLFYYLLIVPILLLPWTSLLVRSLKEAKRDSGDALRRFLWIWCSFVLIFFSFSGTKLPHYALYGCSPLFLLIAHHRERLKNGFLTLLPALLLLALLAALPVLLERLIAAGAVKDAYYLAQLARAPEVAGASYLIACLAALALVVALLFARAVPAWKRLAVSAIATSLLLSTVVTPFVGDLLQGPVKRAALASRHYPETAVQWNFFQPSFAVYRERQAPAREPRPGELALTRFDRLPKDARIQTLYSEGGVRLVKVLP